MDQNVLLGIFYTILAVVAYGSTYVPSRWFEVADGETSSINTGASGIFFQWLMCVGMFIISVIAYLAVGCPTFYPLCMTGGILFALGWWNYEQEYILRKRINYFHHGWTRNGCR